MRLGANVPNFGPGTDPGVLLDPFDGDPQETRRPQVAWQALAAVAANWREPR